MMIFSLVAMTVLEKCCITSAYLQWLCHSGERPVARGPLVVNYASVYKDEFSQMFFFYYYFLSIVYIFILIIEYNFSRVILV